MYLVSGYKLRVMQLHCVLSRIVQDIVVYGLKISLHNSQKALMENGGPVKKIYSIQNPLIIALIKLKDNLFDHDLDLLWMNDLSKEGAETILTDYHPESVIYQLEDQFFLKSLLLYLPAAHDVLLGLALQLSAPPEDFNDPAENFFGFGLMHRGLLNREDPNVSLVLDSLRNITECINCLDLMDQLPAKINC